MHDILQGEGKGRAMGRASKGEGVWPFALTRLAGLEDAKLKERERIVNRNLDLQLHSFDGFMTEHQKGSDLVS